MAQDVYNELLLSLKHLDPEYEFLFADKFDNTKLTNFKNIEEIRIIFRDNPEIKKLVKTCCKNDCDKAAFTKFRKSLKCNCCEKGIEYFSKWLHENCTEMVCRKTEAIKANLNFFSDSLVTLNNWDPLIKFNDMQHYQTALAVLKTYASKEIWYKFLVDFFNGKFCHNRIKIDSSNKNIRINTTGAVKKALKWIKEYLKLVRDYPNDIRNAEGSQEFIFNIEYDSVCKALSFLGARDLAKIDTFVQRHNDNKFIDKSERSIRFCPYADYSDGAWKKFFLLKYYMIGMKAKEKMKKGNEKKKGNKHVQEGKNDEKHQIKYSTSDYFNRKELKEKLISQNYYIEVKTVGKDFSFHLNVNSKKEFIELGTYERKKINTCVNVLKAFYKKYDAKLEENLVPGKNEKRHKHNEDNDNNNNNGDSGNEDDGDPVDDADNQNGTPAEGSVVAEGGDDDKGSVNKKTNENNEEQSQNPDTEEEENDSIDINNKMNIYDKYYQISNLNEHNMNMEQIYLKLELSIDKFWNDFMLFSHEKKNEILQWAYQLTHAEKHLYFRYGIEKLKHKFKKGSKYKEFNEAKNSCVDDVNEVNDELFHSQKDDYIHERAKKNKFRIIRYCFTKWLADSEKADLTHIKDDSHTKKELIIKDRKEERFRYEYLTLKRKANRKKIVVSYKIQILDLSNPKKKKKLLEKVTRFHFKDDIDHYYSLFKKIDYECKQELIYVAEQVLSANKKS